MLAEHEHLRLTNVTLVRRFIDAINDSWNVDVMREPVSDPTRFVIAVGGTVAPPPSSET